MIGQIVGAGLSIGSTIAGSISSRRARKEEERLVNTALADNQSWYNQRYNENYTQRADAQAALQNAKTAMDQRYKYASASAAVSGATDESLAQQKASANNAIANTTTSIVANAENYKQGIQNQYLARRDMLNQQKSSILNRKSNNATAAASQGSALGGMIFNAYSEDQI